jgi:hypothetical protein
MRVIRARARNALAIRRLSILVEDRGEDEYEPQQPRHVDVVHIFGRRVSERSDHPSHCEHPKRCDEPEKEAVTTRTPELEELHAHEEAREHDRTVEEQSDV